MPDKNQHRWLWSTRILLFTLLLWMLAACDSLKQEKTVATQASFEDAATAVVLTALAPPSGFEKLNLPDIDRQINQLPTSRVVIMVSFNGKYDDTDQIAEGKLYLEAFNNQQAVSRLLDLQFEGDVFSGGASNLQAVRVSNSYYMINPNGVCIKDEAQISDIANLRAGQLLGGVTEAGPTGQRMMVNGLQSWQYGFAPEAIVPPQLQTSAELDFLTGEIWFAPEYQIVVRYLVEMNVQAATLLFGNRPVSGRLRYEYNVYDINAPQNISVPNGC
jgi:hypothetical protein